MVEIRAARNPPLLGNRRGPLGDCDSGRDGLAEPRNGSEPVQSALEGGESVVDVLRREFHRFTKFSYSSGGKSICNIENNARPKEERVNGSCGIGREIFVRLLKFFPLKLIHPIPARATLVHLQPDLMCAPASASPRSMGLVGRTFIALPNEGQRGPPVSVSNDHELRAKPVPSLGPRRRSSDSCRIRETPPLREDEHLDPVAGGTNLCERPLLLLAPERNPEPIHAHLELAGLPARPLPRGHSNLPSNTCVDGLRTMKRYLNPRR